MQKLIHVNTMVTDYFKEDGTGGSIVIFEDRVILSGDHGSQVFTKNISSFSRFAVQFKAMNLKEKISICQIKLEGEVNKARACLNVARLKIPTEQKDLLIEKIKDCECSPQTMRKKMKHFFSLTDKDIDMLDLEDYADELLETIKTMEYVCDALIE